MKQAISRRTFLSLIAAGAAGAALAACSATTPTVPTSGSANTTAGTPATSANAPASATATPAAVAAPATKGKQTVRYTMFGHPGLAEQLVAKFNGSHPDVEVQFERSEGQGYAEKLTAALAGGNAWDAFRAPGTFPSRFGPKGAVVDISTFQNTDTTYPATLYLEGLLDTWDVQGKRYGLPGWCLTTWLYYNKKLFDAAGVAYPTPKTTWEEYVDMAKRLTKTESNGQISQYGANGWGSWTLPIAQDVWSAGGCFYYNKDKTQICVNDPITEKVLQDEADLMNVVKAMPSALNPPSTPVSLLSGKVATQIDGDYYPWDNHDAWKYDDYDATLTPLRNGKRTNIYQPDPLVINSKSQVQEGAYKWISWFSADPDSWAIQGKVVFPTTKREYEDPKLRATWLVPPRPPHMIELALEHANSHQIWAFTPYSDEFESKIYYAEIDKLWRNKASAKDVCETITQKGNDLMSKPLQ